MQKKQFIVASILCAGLLYSCGTTKVVEQPIVYLEISSPEESGLYLTKITEEAEGNVIAHSSYQSRVQQSYNAWKGTYTYGDAKPDSYIKSIVGFCHSAQVYWGTYYNIAISPDGKKIAYVTKNNEENNVVIRSTGAQGVTTQRTFRNVLGGICWGSDNRLYFADNNKPNYYISSVNAEKGSTMLQHTNGNVDDSQPVLSADGKILYFTRWTSNYGPSIWARNMETGELSSCTRGFCAYPDPNNSNAIYCVRNSSAGKSEIWHIDYVNGQESVILSDINRSFTNPVLSPDGQWLLVVGNSVSTISKENNTDIFVAKTNGSSLTQLTYHPATDVCPIWSKDGKHIYFISSRANKNNAFNIWRMNFNLQ